MRRKLADATTAAVTAAAPSFMSVVKDMVKQPTFLAAMAAPVAGLAIGRGERWLQERRAGQQKIIAYKEMLDLHPHLRDRDPMQVQRVFNSLHNVSPNMARDPLVAGAWVDEVIELKTPSENSYHAILSRVKDFSGVQSNVLSNEKAMRFDTPVANFTEDAIHGGARWYEDIKKKSLEQDFRNKKEHVRKMVEAAHRRIDESNANREKAVMFSHDEIKTREANLEARAKHLDNIQKSLETAHQGMENAQQRVENDWLRYKRTPTPGGIKGGFSPPPQQVAPGVVRRPGRRVVVDMNKTSSLTSMLRALKV